MRKNKVCRNLLSIADIISYLTIAVTDCCLAAIILLSCGSF